jgi:hypothetical protein
MSWRDGLKRVLDGPDWSAWASGRDFTFAEEAPDLIGVWLPVFDGTSERYVNVVGGRWRSLAFQAFTHGTYRRPHGGVESFSTSNGYLVLQLPGELPPEIAVLSPDDAFKLLGGRIPSSFDFTFRPPNHLFGVTAGNLNPELLEGALENLALQIEAAPPELWQN